MKTKILIIILAVVAIALAGGAIYLQQKTIQPKPQACTQEAKLCPDGSYVSRTGPKCEFAECPGIKDKIAGWKIYRNEEYGFEVQYSGNWIATSAPNTIVKFYQKQRQVPNLDYKLYREDDIMIYVREDFNEEFLTKLKNSSFLVGGKQALKEIREYKGLHEELVRFINNIYVFNILLEIEAVSELSLTEKESIINTFNQILSTFKFIK